LLTAEEIAVIIPEEGVHHALDNRDVVLQARGGQLEQISQNSPLYTALHYFQRVVCKNSNPWCSTKRTRGEYKAKRWGGTGSLTGGI